MARKKNKGKPDQSTPKKKQKAAQKSATPRTQQNIPKKWWSKKLNSNTILAGATIGLVLVGIGALFYQVRQHHQDHRPLVVFIRPLEFLEPFTCDNEKGTMHTGKMQSWIKNVGNAQAKNIFPYWTVFKLVPDKKTGKPFIDDIPLVTEDSCKQDIHKGAPVLSMAPGDELRPQYAQSGMAFPALGKDADVQFYTVCCIYYSDEYDIQHGTCDTYRLVLPDGKSSFVCGHPTSGTFSLYVSGHCQN